MDRAKPVGVFLVPRNCIALLLNGEEVVVSDLDLDGSFLSGFQALNRKPLTALRIRDALNGSPAKAQLHWERVRASDFFKLLALKAEEDFADVVIRYIEAAVRLLPEAEQVVVRYYLGFASDGLQVGSHGLEIRRKTARRVLKDTSLADSELIKVDYKESGYRTHVEGPTLRRLASMLSRPTRRLLSEVGVDADAFSGWLGSGTRRAATGRAVVLGGAVMDINFRIGHLPGVGASVQALNYRLFPGGKALTQAVAAARLGMDTSLIAAIGDDSHGDHIIEFLESENVRTDLIKRCEGEQSAVTGVITQEHVGAFAIGWKNEARLFVGPDVFSQDAVKDRLKSAGIFLASFELPADTVAEGLRAAKALGITTVVTPAPPYNDHFVDPDHHKYIDYLVANTWELTEFVRRAPHPDEDGQIEDFIKPLVRDSELNSVLVVHQQQCHGFVQHGSGRRRKLEQIEASAAPGKLYESAGDRDAFCAMLAMRLVNSDGSERPHESAVRWATMAMAKAGNKLSVPDSMPYIEDFEEVEDDEVLLLPTQIDRT